MSTLSNPAWSFDPATGTLTFTQSAFGVHAVTAIDTTGKGDVHTEIDTAQQDFSGVKAVNITTPGGDVFELGSYGQIAQDQAWTLDLGQRSTAHGNFSGGVAAGARLRWNQTTLFGLRSALVILGNVDGGVNYDGFITSQGGRASSGEFQVMGAVNGDVTATHEDQSDGTDKNAFRNFEFLRGGTGSLTTRVNGAVPGGGGLLSSFVRGNLGSVAQDNVVRFGPGDTVATDGPVSASPY